MVKQKIVIKVPMASDKSRAKAMALVAAAGGVDSVAIAGAGKDQVVVGGEGVDSIKLTSDLRKKMGDAQLVEVAEDKKEEKKPDPVADYIQYYYHYPPPVGVAYDPYSRPGSTCSIM
ncbi:disease resistance protein Pik-1-like [Miscanthus floridulus]|uniref:disease resistance protein Pik-1-like n=1 Tax=Miscanthus floridulus TaxID=154761 RepID=UPI00345B2ED5